MAKSLRSIRGKVDTDDAQLIRRVAAFAIDLLVINIIVLGPFRAFFSKIFPAGSSFSSIYTEAQSFGDPVYSALFAMGILMLLYFTLLEWKTQRTVGKMLLNIRVDPAPTFWQAVLRNMAVLPFLPFAILWIVDPIMMFYTKRRLSDRLSNTRVVQDYFKGWV